VHRTIVVGVLRSGDAVLLVKQAYGGHFWTLPGGVVEPGETLVEALVREMREETGLEVRVQGLLSLRDRSEQTCFVFAVEAGGGRLLESVPGEIEALRWFTAAEVEEGGETIEQFPRLILGCLFRSVLRMLEARPWEGYSGPADLFA